MQPSKSNNNVNRKRRRKGGAGQKKPGMLESRMRAICHAGQDATITTTTVTGENAERTTAVRESHTKMTEVVEVTINDDAMPTMILTMSDNGNAEGGIQVRTTTSGVVIIEKEGEKGPWSETIDRVAGDWILQNGNAVAAPRVAKNGNVDTATLNLLVATLDAILWPPRVTTLRTVRVKRRQSASAPQVQNYDACPRLDPMRTGSTRSS